MQAKGSHTYRKSHLLTFPPHAPIPIMPQVNNFLSTQAPDNELLQTHTDRMESWLEKLEQQIAASWPKKPKAEMPDAGIVYAWVDDHCHAVLKRAVEDLRILQTLSLDTASRVQGAAIAMLAVGSEIPPCRLSLIKSWSTRPGCTDSDCLARQHGQSCTGNRLVLVDHEPGDLEPDPEWDGILNYGTTSILSEVRHGKTDRHARACFIKYTLPRGNLTKLLLLHIKMGHGLLTYMTDTPDLMVTRNGKKLKDANFTLQFRETIDRCPLARQKYQLKSFAPCQARSVFVEDYTADRWG